MKKILIVTCVLGLCSVVYAGKLNLENPQGKAKAVAEMQKSADADAGVTYAQIKDDLQAVGDAIDAINLSSITNTVFTGDQRTAVKNIKDTMGELKTATKNLMQASNKLVKKMKQAEAIDKANGVK